MERQIFVREDLESGNGGEYYNQKHMGGGAGAAAAVLESHLEAASITDNVTTLKLITHMNIILKF